MQKQHRLISELNKIGGEARVTSISERFGVTKAAVSQTIKKLLKYGLVAKNVLIYYKDGRSLALL